MAEATHDATRSAKPTTRVIPESDGLTEVTTKVRLRGDLDMGEAGDGTSDHPTARTMQIALEMGTAVTLTAVDTISMATLEPM